MATKAQKAEAEKAAQEAAAASAVTVSEPTDVKPESPAESESGADSDVEAGAGEPPALAAAVEVVVCAKRTVRHDGKVYGETQALTLPREDAQALKDAGFVAYLDDLRQAAQARQGASVNIRNGVEITQE